MAKHTCCWVLTPASPGVDATYCGKPTSYRIVEDDDGNRVRKYNAQCDFHKQKADEQKAAHEDLEDDFE